MRLFFLVLCMVIFLSLFCLGCFCQNDDDNDSGSDPADDDDSANDDSVDDDDDDTSQPNSAGCEPDGSFFFDGVHFEKVAGGTIGESGTALTVLPNQGNSLAVEDARILKIYNDDGSNTWTGTPQCITWFAEFPDMAVDSVGSRHLVFHDMRKDVLKYATDLSGQWEFELVDGNVGTGEYTAIDLDLAGKVHISYFDRTNKTLKYANNLNGIWNMETVYSNNNEGYYSDVAIDQSGNAHIVYLIQNDVTKNLSPFYATNQGGNWAIKQFYFPTFRIYTLGGVSIEIDSNQNPHVTFNKIWDNVYYMHEYTALIHAAKVSGFWNNEVVAENPNGWIIGADSSMLIDVLGNIHVAYDAGYSSNSSGTWTKKWDGVGNNSSVVLNYNDDVIYAGNDASNKVLKISTNMGGAWQTLAIKDTVIQQPEFCSLVIDDSDTLHIAFTGFSPDEQLRLAGNQSGIWQIDTVDSRNGTGAYNSMTFDEDGYLHVCYRRSISQELVYATNKSGTWQISSIENYISLYPYSSIAVDTNGAVHISYQDTHNFFLKYATNAGGSWQTTIVDASERTGKETSIALDANGNVHIAYRSMDNGNLMYATNAQGSWATEMLDNQNLTWASTDIAIDSAGKVHIAFGGGSTVSLKMISNESGTWVVQNADSSSYAWYDISLALDENDFAHISYYNDIDQTLRYATNSLGTWQGFVVDKAKSRMTYPGVVGKYNSIALDSTGKIHIAYSANGLFHAAFALGIGGPTLNPL